MYIEDNDVYLKTILYAASDTVFAQVTDFIWDIQDIICNEKKPLT